MKENLIETAKRTFWFFVIVSIVMYFWMVVARDLMGNVTADPNQQIEEYIEKYGNPFPCTEDMPCWDCETMGNKQCGTTT